MNFNSLFRVCLIFYTYDSANFKKHRNTTMKKMLLATALALLITGCAYQTFTVQNKPAAVAPKETITHHFVSGIGQKKTVDAAKICGGAENAVKTETQQTFVNGLLGLGHLYRWKRVCIAHTQAELPIDMGNLSALLINILLGSFQLFLHSDQPLSEGEIIPFSGVCRRGKPAIHAGGGGGFTH